MMIDLDLAVRLRDAGLTWRPAERDTFALPGHGMDDQVFVVSPVPALVQLYNGYPVVAFQASSEWALDYVMLTETVWMPSEGQLRETLAASLPPGTELRLTRIDGGYVCAAGPASHEAPDAETAYALALLDALGA
jgi:hypothetical protein